MDDLKTDTLVELHENDPEMISISVICRLCANQNDKLIGIFSDDGLNNDLANKMNMYLPVKVTETDVLPLQCCWQCASTVLAWHDLVITSVEADRRLRNCQFISSKLEEHVVEQNAEVITTDNSLEHEQRESFDEDVPDESPEISKQQPQDAEENEDDENETNTNNKNKNDYYNLINNETNTCLICQQSFLNKLILKKHMKDIHTIVKPHVRRKNSELSFKFFCDICSKGFTRKFDVKKHVQSKHPNDYEKLYHKPHENSSNIVRNCKITDERGKSHYKCDICGQLFKKSYYLGRHRNIHFDTKPFCCHICGKKFRVSDNLTRHINYHHLKVKKFNCDECGKKFSTRTNLKEHLNIHTNNRPFVCDLCGKSYKQKSTLHIHKEFHSDVFKFECTVCAKKFRRINDLKTHQRIHTGDKPFRCKQCGTSLTSRQSLNKHLRMHENNKNSECVCSDCGSNFTNERYLKMHRKIHENP